MSNVSKIAPGDLVKVRFPDLDSGYIGGDVCYGRSTSGTIFILTRNPYENIFGVVLVVERIASIMNAFPYGAKVLFTNKEVVIIPLRDLQKV